MKNSTVLMVIIIVALLAIILIQAIMIGNLQERLTKITATAPPVENTDFAGPIGSSAKVRSVKEITQDIASLDIDLAIAKANLRLAKSEIYGDEKKIEVMNKKMTVLSAELQKAISK